MQKALLSLFFLLFSLSLFPQNGSIVGTVTDETSGEGLIGATILVQGTFTGTITDLEGKYQLKNISPGKYNLVISYVSYDKQTVTVDVNETAPVQLDVKLNPVTVSVDEVVVYSRRKTDTESAIISNVKMMHVIANGISADQIKKSQDSDAAEVIKRVPGITVSDGKFVIVRGLAERYSQIMLNNAPAPSFESSKKAFSFDAVPSGMIQNMMVFKSPAPELPADFAGSVIDIMTRESADINELKVSWSTGYVQNTSFISDFKTYKGGKYDFLGFDDGIREYPAELPLTSTMRDLYVWPNAPTYYQRMDSLQTISRAFNNNWGTYNSKVIPDQSLSVVGQKRILLGKASLGNITALNYKYSSNYSEIIRKDYFNYDFIHDKPEYAYDYIDSKYSGKASLGVIHNWLLIFGSNQRIGLRNMVYNQGEDITTLRSGADIYNSVDRLNTNLRFNQRFIYSGLVDGNHHFNHATRVYWLAGISYTVNNDPDNRRYSYTRPLHSPDSIPYEFVADVTPSVYYGGRITQKLRERNYSLKMDITRDIYSTFSDHPLQFKAGFLLDTKSRDFNTRLIGLVAPRGTSPGRLRVGSLEQPAEVLLADSNFYYNPVNPNITGFMYRDGTVIVNSYTAHDDLQAGYAGLKIPVGNIIDIYGGMRMERFNRLITDWYRKDYDENGRVINDSLDITSDTLNFYPSVSLNLKLNKKLNLKFSYGKTINRPEFRESSPSYYEDFDEVAIYYGNPDLVAAMINNYDLRLEWYPDQGEVISLAVFYKDFTNPIEMFKIPAGTGWNYKPYNTEHAVSKGLELDMRKSLMFLQDIPLIGLLKDITAVFNASLIQSSIHTSKPIARDSVRIMQGQSPYIVNMGLFYNNQETGLMVSLNYNRIGDRIVYAGTPVNPHVWELGRNSVDLTLDKKFGNSLDLKLGLKDITSNPVHFAEYYGDDNSIQLTKLKYIPNRKINIGLNWTF